MGLLKKNTSEFGSKSAFDLLNEHGLTSLEAVFSLGEVIHRRYSAKSVSFVDLEDGGKKTRVYIKKQWKQSRLIPRTHTFFTGKAFSSYPLQEWLGLNNLQDIGLDTAEPLALFQHRWHPYKAAVITRAVPTDKNLYEMITNGEVERLNDSARESLCDTVVSIIRSIHDAGFGWRSMNIKHFYPVMKDDGSWRIWLIDCEGVFSPVKQRHIERERRSMVKLIRKAGEDSKRIENFAQYIEQSLF